MAASRNPKPLLFWHAPTTYVVAAANIALRRDDELPMARTNKTSAAPRHATPPPPPPSVRPGVSPVRPSPSASCRPKGKERELTNQPTTPSALSPLPGPFPQQLLFFLLFFLAENQCLAAAMTCLPVLSLGGRGENRR
ncbi:hypothetical protein LX32DRAFT_391711 [Colletotrichum zoysiae]|uniref:Uncharacterized protein n=1 Tax=Colletotrichum zoysiae TaxID=1216348 RepID=A0AAD9HGL5_9PEZI|nr:hypothetical protein LX32DRAFT_391711 [Colletotrichum zoysiae]